VEGEDGSNTKREEALKGDILMLTTLTQSKKIKMSDKIRNVIISYLIHKLLREIVM
jgi:hypothetical protein